MTSSKPIRVCVIGAGAAGLCCARHLLNAPKSMFECTIFEQSGSIGGTWKYTDTKASAHSSMYKNLRTNLPKEVMAFPDFPFFEPESSFIHHTFVQKYLQNYANHFSLEHCIQFNSIITSIVPKYCNLSTTPWLVTVTDTSTAMQKTLDFDSVMICNGHYSTPFVPEIDGIADFNGKILHSHEYREASHFKGETVAILGASASGLDIAVELSSLATKVYLCHNLPEPIQSKLPPNVTQMPGIISYSTTKGFVLKNEETITINTLLYCTGYKYSFPFLAPSCDIKIVDNRVMDLYKHIINIKYPTMCFIGIPFIVVPFVVIHYQVIFFLHTLTNGLPLAAAMLTDTEIDLKARFQLNMPWKYAHKFGSLQWDYISELCAISGERKPPPVIRKMYEHVSSIRKKQLLEYRSLNYKILSENDFTCS